LNAFFTVLPTNSIRSNSLCDLCERKKNPQLKMVLALSLSQELPFWAQREREIMPLSLYKCF